jgi:Na+/proline symporter
MYPFAGVLLGIFLLGLLTKRANARGVLIGAIAGFLLTLFVPLSEVILVDLLGLTTGSPDSLLAGLIDLHAISTFYYGAFAVSLTMIIGYGASLLFRPMPEEKLVGLVKSTVKD